MRVILLGIPGVGKGTQSKYICEHYHIPKISTGDMLRAEVEKHTSLGSRIKAIMESGALVPDSIIIESVKARISQSDCQGGFLLDGFPRTYPQAEALVREGIAIDVVIEIVVPADEIIHRLSGRRVHLATGRTYHVDYQPPKVPGVDDVTGEPLVQRDDDREETIRKRLEVYRAETQPVVEYYSQHPLPVNGIRPRYIRVLGTGDIAMVRDHILARLADGDHSKKT